jgi:hypothetical protein
MCQNKNAEFKYFTTQKPYFIIYTHSKGRMYVNHNSGGQLLISGSTVCPYNFYDGNTISNSQVIHVHRHWVIPNISAIKYRLKNDPIAKTCKNYYHNCLILTIKAYIEFVEKFDNDELTDLFKEDVKKDFQHNEYNSALISSL